MTNNPKTIKALRENFIKRHHLNPDFFTPPEHLQPELHFTDPALLPRKQFHIKNTPIYNNPIKMPCKQHRHSLSQHHLPPKIQNPESKVLHIVHHNEITQPPFVKTDKLKKSASTRVALSLPKYSSFLLKPYNVQTVKIANRPQSAFSVTKNQLHQASRVRSQKKEQRVRKKSEFLRPWDVDEEQLYSSKI